MTDLRILTGPPKHEPAGPSHPSTTTATRRGSLPAPLTAGAWLPGAWEDLNDGF
jgi:hypothetical protein